MALAILVSSTSSTSSLSPFDPKHEGIKQEYYYDPILREYIIRGEVLPVLYPWDLTFSKHSLNTDFRFGTPATSIINRHSFESSPLHAPLDSLLLGDPLDFPSNTLDPPISLFDQDSFYNPQVHQGILGSDSLSNAWEGYQMLLNDLREHQERIRQLRRTYVDFSGELMYDVPTAQLMEWLISRFENSTVPRFLNPETERTLELSFGSRELLTLLMTKEEVVYDKRRKRIREKIHEMSNKFVLWLKTASRGR